MNIAYYNDVDTVTRNNFTTQRIEYPGGLQEFLSKWDASYEQEVQEIDLFNPTLVKQWTQEQAQYFVKVFYHSRGHFRDLLWYLGNFAPDKKAKDIILANIAEEFNGDSLSHEQLYLDYAKSMGVDLKTEFLDHKFYLKEMYDFNQAHLRWASQHDWDHCFSAFSAYERLDTADYTLLANIQETEHKFFTIHRKAKHFEKTSEVLERIWKNNQEAVIKSFRFIAITQIKMWQDLSDAVFAGDQ